MQKDIKIGAALIFFVLLLLLAIRLRQPKLESSRSPESDDLKIVDKHPAYPERLPEGAVRTSKEQGPASRETSDDAKKPRVDSGKLAEKLKSAFGSLTEKIAPSTRTHTVRPGDTLYHLAKRYYGDGSRWKDIFEANRGTLKDPDMLPAGALITIPRLPGEKGAGPPGNGQEDTHEASRRDVMKYEVRKGDTLSSISKKFLGGAGRYREILKLNGEAISNPDVIFPGQVILIPAAKGD
jgi:nucleoid-associated protein YgaU